MEFLPKEIEYIIYDYKYQLDKEEHKKKFHNVLSQLEFIMKDMIDCLSFIDYHGGITTISETEFNIIRNKYISKYILIYNKCKKK